MPATAARHALADVALGRVPADLVIRGGRLVEVHTGAILDADVAIKSDRIASVGDVTHTVGPDTEVLEAAGAYLLPGFIDCHLHVGGSQMGMTELARLLVSHGTAAISTCFYEAGMIAGFEAIQFFVEEARATPLRILLSPFAACYLGYGIAGTIGRYQAEDLVRLLDFPECVEIREWNVFLEEVPDPTLKAFIEEARSRGKIIGGHLEGQTGRILQASVALGASSDHEVGTAEGAIERARLGVRVQIRQGSAAWDLAGVVRAITEHRVDPRLFMFSTDEEEVDRLSSLGHIDHKLRLAVASGLSPVTAVQMASLNAAEFFRITDDLGSIAPGRVAHINVCVDLANFELRAVVSNGQIVLEDGVYKSSFPVPEYPESFRETIHLSRPVTESDFAIAVDTEDGSALTRVIAVREGSLLTEEKRLLVPVNEGLLGADASNDIAKICVLDRHHASGRIGRGLITGLGLRRGAFGATFNPGLMNLMTVGMNDRDMSVAANRLTQLGGGAVAVLDGNVLAEVALPLLGIASDRPVGEVVSGMAELREAIRSELGSPFEGLLTSVGFTLCAISIPGLKICEFGLVNVTWQEQELVDLIVDAHVPALEYGIGS